MQSSGVPSCYAHWEARKLRCIISKAGLGSRRRSSSKINKFNKISSGFSSSDPISSWWTGKRWQDWHPKRLNRATCNRSRSQTSDCLVAALRRSGECWPFKTLLLDSLAGPARELVDREAPVLAIDLVSLHSSDCEEVGPLVGQDLQGLE